VGLGWALVHLRIRALVPLMLAHAGCDVAVSVLARIGPGQHSIRERACADVAAYTARAACRSAYADTGSVPEAVLAGSPGR